LLSEKRFQKQKLWCEFFAGALSDSFEKNVASDKNKKHRHNSGSNKDAPHLC
jgi:hypothetical protein